MIRKDFCVLILSHGRPDNIKTLQSLRNSGYTGPWFIVVDDEDPTVEQYRKNYGNKVIQFCKADAAMVTDAGDNRDNRASVVYARNECFAIARNLGYKHFVELDDDYTEFSFTCNAHGVIKQKRLLSIDEIFNAFVNFLEKTPFLSVAIAQDGDFMSGYGGSGTRKSCKRKVMQTFFCSTDKPFQFLGRMNDDVNTYVALGHRGGLFLSVHDARITQMQTQSNPGGLTDMYLDAGTFVKSFYTIMYCPSAVRITQLGQNHKRLHHKVLWENAVPKILPESFRKT